MSHHGTRRAALSALLAIPLGLTSASALASESLEVTPGSVVYLDGTVQLKTVIVRSGGVLRVRTTGSGATGTLTLQAESVLVEQGGKIDASGSGFSGTTSDGVTPACCAAAAGAAGSAAPSAPGGGGGNRGNGAAGCPDGGKGGTAYEELFLANKFPGSAGGASFLTGQREDNPPIEGGHGGGTVSIVATTVTVDGEIRADGAPGIAFASVGSGAGAGGVIDIRAYELLGSGVLSVRGGDGGVGFSGIGGGGGGGVIWIETAQPTATDAMGNPLPSLDVAGGATGPGTNCAAGGAGEVKPTLTATFCPDADGDLHLSAACGGDDCDDADPTVHGGNPDATQEQQRPAVEICDGQDNDCNGDADTDDAGLIKDACPAGQSCTGGRCEADGDGGAGGGGGGEPAPDHVDYRGACDMGSMRAAHVNGALFFGAALVSFLAALGARRKRR